MHILIRSANISRMLISNKKAAHLSDKNILYVCQEKGGLGQMLKASSFPTYIAIRRKETEAQDK